MSAPLYTIKNGKTYFTFSNGREIEIQNVSPLLGELLAEKYPKPEPPTQKILSADGQTWIEEPNPASPIYDEAMKKWTELIEQKSRIVLIYEGAVLPELTPSQLAEVQHKRDFMKKYFDIDLDSNDQFCYVAYILIRNHDDYNQFASAIMGRSQPTEAAIVKAIEDSFPGPAQG